jgi:PKD repeat protein
MKRPLNYIRRHPKMSAGIAAMFLAALVTFVVRAAGPAQGPVHASAPGGIALASATTGSASSTHSAFTALTRHERHAVATTATTTTTAGRSGGHGVATQPTTSAALSQSLQQATGLTPSQVTSRNVCPSLGRGQARCAAEALVLRSNGTLVRPRVRREATLGRVHPLRRSATGRRAAAGSTTAAPTTGQPTSVTPPTPDTPAYLQQAYDLSYLSQTGGTGDTVGIVDAYDDATAQSDLDTYRSNYGLSACDSGCFTKVNESGNASPLPAASSDWDTEISLDLDAVSAICPNCHILLVEASSSNQSDLQAAMQTAARLHANQISDSWTLTGSGHVSNYTPSGVPTVAATGDQGYVGSLTPGSDNYPAAFPGVTAAGGTSLAPAATSNARGFSESAWSVTQTPDGPAGGGSGCDVNESRPTYQPNMGCNGRAYADLSADADPNTGLEVVDDGNWGVLGGTSLAAPLIAAYYAITGIDDTTSSTSGKWAYTTPDSALLNDITSGSNGTCSAYPYICTAGTGYDGPTGMGSISGAVATGAPGIGGPPIKPQYTPATPGASNPDSYTESTRADGATITGGIYPNGLDTTWWIQYWPANGGGSVQQTPASDIGSGTSPVMVTGYPTHLSSSTTYDYELVAQNSDGTTDGYTYSFTTGTQSTTAPVAAFTSSPAAATPGSSVSFSASGSTDSGASIEDYSWDFGDGTTADSHGTPTDTHSYTKAGTYNVTLIVTNSNGESETITQTVTVDSAPTASFNVPAQPTPGTATAFNAGGSTDSVGTITDYSWNFGDGSPVDDAGNAATATHSYATRGHYTVTLTVTNDAGQTATFHQTITVDDPPTVTISPTVAVTTPGSTVSFNGTATAPDSGGSITGLSWNFGDPSSANNTSTATNPSHLFANAGTYTVTLTATDDLGVTTQATATVKVDAPPTASFSASATTATPATPGTAVSFNASASSDSVGTITNYSWSFGDGSSDLNETTPTDTHTYATRGNYTVQLTVTNDDGQTAQSTQTVTVDDPPTASVTPSATVSTPSSPVSFTSTAASPDAGGSISTYNWSFGDNTSASVQNPSHTYTSPGVYTVTLTVTDDLGVSSSASTTITIDAVPSVTFTPSANPVTAGSTVAFNAGGSSDSYGTITSYNWNFGDGTTATGAAPSHAYASPGTYTVSLTVTNDAGQSATQTGTITVNSAASPTPPTTTTTTTTTPPTPTPTPAPTPAPVPTAQPLSASLTGAKKQKLAPALAHGVKVSLAVSQSTRATFQVTLPVLQSKLAHGPRSKNASIALLRTGAQTLGAGTHAISLKLSRAAARELASSGPLVLTVKVTLAEAGGGTLTRSVKITLAR